MTSCHSAQNGVSGLTIGSHVQRHLRMWHYRGRSMRSRRAWLAVMLFGLLVSWGCSQSGGRQSLEGTVTLDGKPLAEGSIVFVPQPGTKSPTCGGTISEGHFSIAPAGGAFTGKFRVEITAIRTTGRKVARRQDGKMMDETAQVIPARYNAQSELTATVTEKGPNRFEFPLKSK
jgi:hypothetical protein